MEFPESMSIGEAQDILRTLLEDGHECPLCLQFCKMYKRSITSTMAASLIKVYHASQNNWVHLPSIVGAKRADEAKLRYWNLMLEETEVRRDDGGRAGWWQITPKGVNFVEGRITVPKYAFVYNGACYDLDGPDVSIQDCLGDHFDYRELMNR